MNDSSDDLRQERLAELFEGAIALSPEEWPAYLARNCGDEELRSELTSLLASHAAAPNFLDEMGAEILGAAFGHEADQDLLPGQTVGRYSIIEPIGKGGMGVVYKARDQSLDRLVALKFLSGHLLTSSRARARLTSEARAASALDHPNIAVVYEIGSMAEGNRPGNEQLFIAMACYEGETLKDKITRGPLAIPEAVDYAVQLADGLATAHEAGIVHCDIKPDNVMVTGRGRVKILDFGVARVANDRETGEGARIGTLAYMSPEQTRGEPVDQRTDLWSTGVVLYEMLTGVRPYPGPAEDHAMIDSICNHEPAPIESLRPDIPPPLTLVVRHCLMKSPAQRYRNASALLVDLRAISRDLLATAKSEVQPSIVVLPFVNISADPDNEYFTDGLTDEVIADLSRLRSLRVISRTSAMRLKGSDRDVREIARKVGVRYVLEGGVRKAGASLRITTQLVDAHTEKQLCDFEYPFHAARIGANEGDFIELVAGHHLPLKPGSTRCHMGNKAN